MQSVFLCSGLVEQLEIGLVTGREAIDKGYLDAVANLSYTLRALR